jgi:flagellar basal-body rod protein FlgG
MLFGALSVSNTGIQAASTYLDVVGNNIANSGTTGFKTRTISFADLLYAGPTNGFAAAGLQIPQGTQLGTGTAVGDIVPTFTQGPIQPTGQPFDVAIDGRGFFAVTLPDGSTGYTRAGTFNLDASGQLVTPDGFILNPGITIPAESTSVSIAADGTVTAVTPDNIELRGQITLTTFPNPSGLLAVGDNVFVAGPAAGAAVTGVPGTSGLGTLTQGFLEGSNVELANELVSLIIAQNAFRFNAQAIVVEDAALQATSDLIPLG